MQKILNHRVTRIILGLLVCLIVFIATQNISARLLKDTGKELLNLVKCILISIAVISANTLYFFHRRRVSGTFKFTHKNHQTVVARNEAISTHANHRTCCLRVTCQPHAGYYCITFR